MNNVADAMFLSLAQLGAEHVFLVPGDDPYMHHAIDKHLTPIVMRDERAAAFAAQIYGRLKMLGVCATSHGPGMANLATGLAAAQLEHDPVIAISSQFPEHECRAFSHAYISEELLRPVTKCLVRVNSASAAIGDTASAVSAARRSPAGPVSIILPQDVSTQPTDKQPNDSIVDNDGDSSSILGDVTGFTKKLSGARNILVVVGAGPARDNATRNVQDLIQHLGASAVTTLAGKGTLGKIGDIAVSRHNLASVLDRFDFDVILMVGVDFSEGLRLPEKARTVMSVRSGAHQLSVGDTLTGSLRSAMDALVSSPQPERMPLPVSICFRKAQHIVEQASEASSTFRGLITVDTGLYKHAWASFCKSECAGRVIITNGLSSIGWSLGAAIGASVATQNSVLAVTGDGGLSMSASELFAINQHDLPVSILVVNDQAYGMIQRLEIERTQRTSSATVLKGPNLEKLARAFGFQYVLLNDKNVDCISAYPSTRTLFELPVTYNDYKFSHK